MAAQGLLFFELTGQWVDGVIDGVVDPRQHLGNATNIDNVNAVLKVVLDTWVASMPLEVLSSWQLAPMIMHCVCIIHCNPHIAPCRVTLHIECAMY